MNDDSEPPRWARPDDYVGMGPRCICGHTAGAHLRDMRTMQDTGPCRRGHYGTHGRYVGGGCPCARFRPETTAQTDLLDELVAPVDSIASSVDTERQ